MKPRREARRASYREALGYGAMSTVALALFGVVSSIIIARIFKAEVIGAAAIALAPYLALQLLSSFREQAALVRKLATLPPRDPRITGLSVAVMAFSTALVVAVSMMVAAGTWWAFNGPVDRPELIAPALCVIAAYAVIGNPGWNLNMVLSSFRAGRELFAVKMVSAVSFFVIAIIYGLVIEVSVWGLVAATIGSWVVALAHRIALLPSFMRFFVSTDELRAGFRELPEMIRFSLKLGPGQMAAGISEQSVYWILAVMFKGALGDALIGAFNRAQQLSKRLIDTRANVVEVLLPTLVERRSQGDHGGFDRALVDSVRYVVIILLLCAAMAGGAARGVMELYGPDFVPGADALAILMVAPALAAATAIFSNGLIAENRPGHTALAMGARLVVTLVAVIVLADIWGITGAAAGMVIGFGVEAVIQGVLLRRHLSRGFTEIWPVSEMAILAGAYAIAFLLARMVDQAVPGLISVVPALAVGAIAFLAIMFGLRGFNARDRQRLAEFRSRRRGGKPPGDVPEREFRVPDGVDPDADGLDGPDVEQGEPVAASGSRTPDAGGIYIAAGSEDEPFVYAAGAEPPAGRYRRPGQRRRVVVAATLVCAALGVVTAWVRPPEYSAEALLRVPTDRGGFRIGAEIQTTARVATNFSRLIDDQPVVTRVAEAGGPSASEARDRLEATTDGRTTLIAVRGRADDPEAAVELANLGARALQDHVRAIGQSDRSGLLEQVAAAEAELRAAESAVSRIESALAQSGSDLDRARLRDARTEMSRAELTLRALELRASADTGAPAITNDLEFTRPADEARSDTRDALIRWLFIGGGGGLAIGLLIALLWPAGRRPEGAGVEDPYVDELSLPAGRSGELRTP